MTYGPWLSTILQSGFDLFRSMSADSIKQVEHVLLCSGDVGLSSKWYFHIGESLDYVLVSYDTS